MITIGPFEIQSASVYSGPNMRSEESEFGSVTWRIYVYDSLEFIHKVANYLVSNRRQQTSIFIEFNGRKREVKVFDASITGVCLECEFWEAKVESE